MDNLTRLDATKLDNTDPLKHFRNRFVWSDPNLIYLDGNSLGMLPHATISTMDHVIGQEWGSGLIRSWNTGWYERSKQIAAKIAPLVGAQPDEIIVTDSTSVNIFKLAYAALKLKKGEGAIVTDELNFPSDIYLFQGLVDMFENRHPLRIARSHDGLKVSMEELDKSMGNDTALLSLSHVLFKSAFMYDMGAVTKLAHDKGALVLWDLSHSAGAVPVHLNDNNVDMAVGCTYKYLNGGPGSVAFLYVRKDLQELLQSPIWGWFGQNDPFAFDIQYKPAAGIERFMAGTPPILSLSAIEPSLDILLEAGIDNLRIKSIAQSEYLIRLIQAYLKPLGFDLASPIDASHRGSHIALRHPEAYRICKSLIDPETGEKVILPDFRQPDIIRLGIAPLYTRFIDLYDTVMEIKSIVDQNLFERFSIDRELVT